MKIKLYKIYTIRLNSKYLNSKIENIHSILKKKHTKTHITI